MASPEKEGEEEQDIWRGLVQVQDGAPLFSPISNSARIKFTCIAVSPTHVALGANSGGVYCFNGDNHQFTGRLLANREGSISLMKFSPDHSLLAVVAGGHNVCFWEHNLLNGSTEAKKFHVSSILKDSSVTDMVWDKRGTRLFYGDDQGRIVIAFVPRFTRKFAGSSLFKRIDEILCFEKAPIFQLDIYNDLLLVSSKERCFLLKLQGESIESLILVGKKAIRNGFYGACFYPRTSEGEGGGQPPIVYSARPKGRLWAANVNGDVISTVKPLDFAVSASSSSIINVNSDSLPLATPTKPLPSLNYCRLGLLNQHYLVTWHKDFLLVQVFKDSSYYVKEWTVEFSDIDDIVFTGNKIYLLHGSCQTITCLTYLSLNELMNKIIDLKNTNLLKEILVQHNSLLKAQVFLDILTTAKKCLLESGLPLPSEIQELLIDNEDQPQEEESMKEKEKCELPTGNGVEPPPEVKEDTSLFNMEDDNGDPVAPPPLTTPPPEEPVPLNEEVAPSTDRVLSQSLPEDTATHIPTDDTIGHSLPQLPGHAHQLHNPTHQLPDVTQQPVVKSPPTSSLPVSSVSPSDALPLIARMGSIKTSDDDLVVVRKRRGSGKKKRRGSADSGTVNRSSSMISQLSLDDILEGQISTIISPTHSQLSSAVASADNSPHASLPSSPPVANKIITPSVPMETTMEETTTEETDGRPSLPPSPPLPSLSPSLPSSFPPPPPSPPPPPRSSRSQSWESQLESDLLVPTKMILSRVKSMASSQDGSIQRTGRKVKGLLLSSISPTPLATAQGGVASNVGVAPNGERVVSPELSSGFTSPEVGVAFDSRSPSSFSSPVHLDNETEKFTASVNGAMHSLSSPVVLCSADNMRKLLLKWVGQLHNYHTHLESISVSFKEALSSAHFLSPVKDSISELLIVCLEMEIFPSKGSGDDLSKEDAMGSETQAEIAEGSGVGSETLDKHASSIDTGSEIKPKGSDDANCVSKGPDDDDLFVDFIATYCSHALSYDVIKVHINNTRLARTTSVWRKLAAEEQEEVDQTSADINESDMPPLITPRALSNLYTKDPDAFLSVGLASFPSVKLWEVISLCQLDYFRDKMAANADLTTYCKYLDAIFGKHSPSSLDLMNYFNNPQLIITSVAAVLLAPPRQEVKDQQDNPIEGSHLASWPHETSLTGLTRVTCTSTEVGVVESVASMFEREGYWKGYVQICVSKKKKDQLIKVAAYLRSSSLLHKLTTNGYPFKSTTAWKSFTSQLVKLVIPVHPVSPDGLNWETVLREMVCMIGVEETGKVLETMDSVSWSLPHQLHELFVRLASVHKEQRTIAHNLLEKVDRYLWSVRPTTLGPHVSIVLQKDEAKSTEEETNDDTTKTEVLRDIMSPPPLSHPLISPITMEDWASHWGIRTSTIRCGLCGHSLMNRISDKERGGIGFQCGHAFHKQCCPEQACTLCFLLKYRTHLTNNTNKR